MTIQTQAAQRTFGVEIEARGMTVSEASRALRHAEANNENLRGWKVVFDGTSGVDFEVVSPILRQDENGFQAVRDVCQLFNDLGCDVNHKCGLHVHIGVRDLNSVELANTVNRYNYYSQFIDRQVAPSRRANNNLFCTDHSSKIDANQTCQQMANAQRGRYYKMNLKSYLTHGTLENRHHQGTLNASKIINWVKFVAIQIETAKADAANAVTTPTSTVSVQQAATQLRGKTLRVLQLLQRQAFTAQQLAYEVDSTVKSVQSMICKIRKTHTVRTRRGYYSLVTTETQTTTTSHAGHSALYDHVPVAMIDYFNRRRVQLNTQQSRCEVNTVWAA
jgi:hypothetical protein